MQNMSKWHATLWNTVQRGQTTSAANEANHTQGLQMQRNAYQLSEFESWKHFGFAASEPEGSDVIYVAPGGQGSQAVVIASNHGASRPTGMQAGETQVYDQWGNSIYFTQDKLTISHATEIDIVIGGTVVGKFTSAGLIDLVDAKTQAGVDLNQHVHSGVQTGGGNTQKPVT